ncbi:rhodanese-like domain-containing protein [Spiroplasma alleghenense]|uniref:Rhodanese domain-containing protein n=1 Tax=Spiroplasma alleghenense TaxID=216931 RepID=A0A345Z2K6_9MOLU|nr:rhodanese-like domain-containing protein [Spiroplasma alleghenense]AXK50835.1 hypothetical protein SALLE_v1c01590 [Spiroplasma alleghenense]
MKYQEIEKLFQEGYKIIDVRDSSELELLPKLEIAENIALGELIKHCQENFKLDSKFALICRSGMRSQIAFEQLKSEGFSNVINLAGGMLGVEK